MKKIVRLTESDLNRIVRKVLNEQKSIDINFIIKQSNSDKDTDSFCKSKSDYDICLMEKSSDRNALVIKYGPKKEFLQSNGYSMVEESGLRQDPESNYVKSSIWKKIIE
jgi:hypothetical protein